MRVTQVGAQIQSRPRDCKRFGFVTRHWETGKVTDQHAASQETGLQDVPTPPVGCDRFRRINMNTETKTIAVSIPSTVSIAFVFLTGIALLLASGYAQATALHDAAHDQRHAMAFPCH